MRTLTGLINGKLCIFRGNFCFTLHEQKMFYESSTVKKNHKTCIWTAPSRHCCLTRLLSLPVISSPPFSIVHEPKEAHPQNCRVVVSFLSFDLLFLLHSHCQVWVLSLWQSGLDQSFSRSMQVQRLEEVLLVNACHKEPTIKEQIEVIWNLEIDLKVGLCADRIEWLREQISTKQPLAVGKIPNHH